MEVIKCNQVGLLREYRKGNWTVEETMILIEAKKLDEQRRMIRSTSPNAKSTTTSSTSTSSMNMMSSSKPTGGELRWKWVEDYCWKKGCLRSQNQCNDKWDNLMRDYKKVREYERRRNTEVSHNSLPWYWDIEKTERKQHSLPSNMLPQIYEALAQVVETKLTPHGSMVFLPSTTTITTTPRPPPPLPPPPPPPPPLPPLPPPQPAAAPSQPLPTADCETESEECNSDSKGKKRKREDEEEMTGGIIEAISGSVSVLAEAIKGYEEREERRHRELYIVHQKRLKIEESKAEMDRQGFSGLVDAINNLSNSILALASQRNQTSHS